MTLIPAILMAKDKLGGVCLNAIVFLFKRVFDMGWLRGEKISQL
jgi:hypothetical protein